MEFWAIGHYQMEVHLNGGELWDKAGVACLIKYNVAYAEKSEAGCRYEELPCACADEPFPMFAEIEVHTEPLVVDRSVISTLGRLDRIFAPERTGDE
jgi:hypothetical protein